jgi:1-acyl-sn-glycerol-3-phosphate acyltransferase
VIVLHPEGTVTRDPDGWPMNGKTGVARLALLAPDVPVIPIAQWGVQNSIDLYRKRMRLSPRPKHTLCVGEPIDLSRFRGKEPSPAVLHEITEVIVRRLRDDVAALRGVPAPTGELFRWTKGTDTDRDAA